MCFILMIGRYKQSMENQMDLPGSGKSESVG